VRKNLKALKLSKKAVFKHLDSLTRQGLSFGIVAVAVAVAVARTAKKKMAITRTRDASEQMRLVSVREIHAGEDDENYNLEQRAQFSITGIGSLYEMFYHRLWDCAIIECIPSDWLEPSTYVKVERSDATMDEILKMFLSRATGGAVTDYTLDFGQPWNDRVQEDNYKNCTARDSPIAQFTVVTAWASSVSYEEQGEEDPIHIHEYSANPVEVI
jgi:hypothetical protein